MFLTSATCFDTSLKAKENEQFIGIGLNHYLYNIFTTESNYRKIKKVNFHSDYELSLANTTEAADNLTIIEIENVKFLYD